ncbi:protein dispatched homolog 1-like [Patiria miniata]|uniref:SSD domain-containing protein n=1 Tax=Patiria miniata TaxID=46514 RepID=A0A914A1J2_PATMI|nr:protein dispatched homolog 1-like [Patiria miniata]
MPLVHRPSSGPDDSNISLNDDTSTSRHNGLMTTDSDDIVDTAPGGVCYTYAKILARFWYVICILVFITVAAFTALPLTLYDLPDFSEPSKGFDARGTVISARLNSLQNLFADRTNLIVFRPADAQMISPNPPVSESHTSRQQRTRRQAGQSPMTGIQFCFPLWETSSGTDWGTLVFERVDGGNMLTTEAIKSVCKAEERLVTSHPSYQENCQCPNATATTECPSTWSIGNHIALLSNKSSCAAIVDSDVANTIDLLMLCAPFFRNTTAEDFQYQSLPMVPDECRQHEYAVFTIFHYLLPIEVLRGITDNSLPPTSRIVSVLLPIEDKDALKTIFQESIQRETSTDGITTLKAVDFNIKFRLFSTAILLDSLYLGIAAGAIFLLIWVYTGSFLVTLTALLNMVFSFTLADFFFTVAFVRPFFPFGNIMSVILLLGVGADDTFVYMDLWKKCRLEFGDQDLPRLVYETLRHASVSMFVTSFTTATALYVTVISDIVVVKCFAVFAGTAILMNLALTLTLLPAVIVMQHKMTKWCCSSKTSSNESKEKCSCLAKLLVPLNKFHEVLIPYLVLKLRFIWIILFLLLMTGAAIVVFFYPGFQVPSSSNFQFFVDSHYFEQYDLVYGDQFAYTQARSSNFVGCIVWGVQAVDNGDLWDPDDPGTLLLNDSFRFSSPEDQSWFLDFCRDLRNQSFFKSFEEQGCFIEDFISLMQQPSCINQYGRDVSPCCNQSGFPYESSLFETCLAKFANYLSIRGIFFLKTNGQLAGIKVNIATTFENSFKFADNEELWRTVNGWIEEKLKSAPSALQHGWFSSPDFFQLSFFDLQQSLAVGTRNSMLVTLAIASGILFLTIQNILLTLWAMLTITSAVFVTVASLVLLGWELNVVEATIITLAVGLSVDFTIHYGVAYKLSPFQSRRQRTRCSLQTMAPAITIAAFSTFVAGALVLPSTLLSYYQFGVFLMLVMSISWTHGTFFFQSLCMVLGPQESCGDIPCLPCFECCRLGTRPVDALSSGQGRASYGHDNPAASIRTITNGEQ